MTTGPIRERAARQGEVPGRSGDVWSDWVLPLGFGAAAALLVVAVAWPRRAEAAYYVGPVVHGGRVLSRFGPRTKQGVTRPHWGVDLLAPRGTPIGAAGAGTVMAVFRDGQVQGYGNLVTVRHADGEGALYAHMDSIDPAIVPGAKVVAGQRIGVVGCTDSEGGFDCAGAHLHFEVLTPAPGDDRAYSHVRGGEDPYPTRTDPQSWAIARGVVLV